jgi:N6-adenosine-specific RNA methylase IME4
MTRKGKEIILAPTHGVITETGWSPPEGGISREQLVEAGRYVARLHGATGWVLGDIWLHALKRKYGEGEKFAAELGVSYATIRKLGSICKSYELFRRRNNPVTFTHHEAALTVKNRAERDEWLTKAEANGWSVRDLRLAIQRDRTTHRHRKLAEVTSEQPFSLVYCDPPWLFETRSDLGKVMTSADNHYPPMPLEDICNLKIEFNETMTHISEVIADDAAMFMWATVPCLFHAPVAWRAWGFRADHLPRNPNHPTDLELAIEFAGGYSGQAMWDKEIPGTGYVFRNQHEVLFHVRRGEPPKPIKTFPSVFRFRKGKHSAKPPQIRKYIEEMYPTLGPRNRIELFARGKVPGWTVWGNEAEPSILSPDSNIAPVDLRPAAVKVLTDELSERHPFVPNRPQRAIKGD